MVKTTYSAVQVAAPGKLEPVERVIPEPGPGQVRIRVEACGVCHTDALTVEGTFPGLVLPRVPGHEVIGRIEALGNGVSGWTIGQRVGVGFLGGYCTVCENCRRGDFTHCRQRPVVGVHLDGGYAEVMLAQIQSLVRIPEELKAVEAAPLLCAGVTTFNALRKSKARARDLIAVQGVGGLGHLAIQFARATRGGGRHGDVARAGAGRRDDRLQHGLLELRRPGLEILHQHQLDYSRVGGRRESVTNTKLDAVG
jgi:D-arabinose 1-dehydrogenase-like Zn-dependent alcohol dehydrogenase